MMIGFIFNLIGAAAHLLWNLFCALATIGWNLLSAVAAVLCWPAKAGINLLQNAWNLVPLFAGVCLVLAVLVSAMALACLWRRHRR